MQFFKIHFYKELYEHLHMFRNKCLNVQKPKNLACKMQALEGFGRPVPENTVHSLNNSQR